MYELHENGAIVATGRLTLEQHFRPGDSFRLGQLQVRVRELVNTVAEQRLILERC